ncbi:tRNA pseudouridine(55) synthase TruB [Candidatus Microgenomates bacterium CPR3]|nr:tRNA pseudouridine(55) synthase TruB [Candidatus Microgenomates bacterium CPR3]
MVIEYHIGHMDAILPVYKPVGITSFDVIRAFKRSVKPSYKVGHGGTLDPFADGVLILLLGKATKLMSTLSTLPKTYHAKAVLGATSDTLDVTGTIVESGKWKVPSNEEILTASDGFVGQYEQEIPQYSAAKVNGKPRYLLARKGEVTERKFKQVEIYSLKITNVAEDSIEFITKVSSGTYIRQLSYDIFKKLGIDSYLENLTRTEIGDFSIEKFAKVEYFMTEAWQDKLQPLG